MFRFALGLIALVPLIFPSPTRSEQILWANSIEQVYFPSIVSACQNSSMFGVNPWTGFIEPLSGYDTLDFRCSWSNPFGDGPAFNDYCRNNAGATNGGACREQSLPVGCGGNGEATTTHTGDEGTGNPASLSSGQKYEIVEDWVSPKDPRFSVTRTYRTNFSVFRDMGLVWQTNWSDRIQLLWPSLKLRVESADGGWHEFQDLDGDWNNGTGNWQPTHPDTTMALVQSGSNLTLTHADGLVETFAPRSFNGTNTWHYSVLSSRQWPDGYRVDLTFDAEGYPVTIADNRGQTATVAWFWLWTWGDGSPVTEVRKHIDYIDIDYDDPATTTPSLRLDYTYTATSGEVLPGRITSATVQDLATGATETIGTYEYYDGYHDAYLRTAFDGNGVAYGNFGYSSTIPFVGNMVRSNHPGDADRTEITYDTPYQSTVTNILGRSTVYNFADIPSVTGRRITSVDGIATANCLATTQSLGYTPAPAGAPHGYVYERVHRNGAVTRYERNARGLITKETEDALGADPRVTLKEWHPTLILPTRITTDHLDEVFTYDAGGMLLTYSQTDVLAGSPSNGETRTWTFTYQTLASGLKVLAQVDGPGLAAEGVNDVTSYGYDADGNLRTVTTAEGLLTEIVTVNARGQPTLVRQPDGVETAFAYDFRSRLTSTTRDPNGAMAATSFTYDAIGQITSMTLPEGGVWSYTYDDARRLTQVQNPLGEKILYTYDLVGNVTHTEYQTASGGVTFFFDQQFDELGRILASTGAEAQVWNFAHDVEDNLNLITDPLSHTVQRSFDPLNRLVQVTDELSQVTTMDHDENDAVTAFTDPRGLTTTTDYNGFGEVIAGDSPDRGLITYSYNRRGLVATVTDGRGVPLVYAYDDDGRLTGISYPSSPTEDRTFTYDAGGGINAGHLTGIADASGTTARTYDAQGRIAGETRTIDGLPFTVGYAYDDEDLVSLLTYPSGRQVQYLRDAAGQVTDVQQRPDAASPWEDVASFIEWEPFGDLAQMTRGNGILYTGTHDQSYRLIGQADTGTGALRDLVYDYSLRDNLTSVLDLVMPAENAVYGYDPRQMLLSADGPWGELDWTYDAVGNRLSERAKAPGQNGNPKPWDYTYEAASNRLDQIKKQKDTRDFTYDGAGNTIAELRKIGSTENWAYAYDAAGRLASVSIGSTAVADYLYNALGQQVHRTVHFGGGTAAITLSVHDLNGNRLSEHDSGGMVLREYIWLDGRPLAIVEGGQTFWLHWDHIGRPVMATDASGTVVWAASYLPFGGIREVLVDTGVVGQDIRFPGQWFQAETGLHQNWHRDYDPTAGRYLQADPLGLVDGPSVYGYARQNPVRFTDPTGEFAQTGALCLAGPVGCTVAAVITVAAGIVAIADPFDLTSSAPTPRPSNSDEECGDDEDECNKKREIEETSCYAFANRRGGGRSAKANLKLCMDSAFERWVQCRQGVPEQERRPLFGVQTPL